MSAQTPAEKELVRVSRKVHDRTERRNALIREMYEQEGYSLRVIGELAGLSHTAIKKIVEREQ